MQKMDLEIMRKFNELDQKGKIQAEYVWIGGSNELRCKTRTLAAPAKGGSYTPADLPIWNFDGSSTGQAPGDDSEVLLKPCAIFPDPFRGAPHLSPSRRTDRQAPSSADDPYQKVKDCPCRARS